MIAPLALGRGTFERPGIAGAVGRAAPAWGAAGPAIVVVPASIARGEGSAAAGVPVGIGNGGGVGGGSGASTTGALIADGFDVS